MNKDLETWKLRRIRLIKIRMDFKIYSNPEVQIDVQMNYALFKVSSHILLLHQT